MKAFAPAPRYSIAALCALAVLAGLAEAGAAAVLSPWVDWTSGASGAPGSATGTLSPSWSAPLSVTYTGEIAFLQASGGTNYWNPSTPYVSASVPNAPPPSDIIAFAGGNAIVNTITFSRPVTNPVMAVVSLGQGPRPVEYLFDAPFDVLSSGRGYWGEGAFYEKPGNVLHGEEGHGTIGFRGTFTTIRWTVPVYEHWHGFTVGLAVPEPLTLTLFAVGAVTLVRRRR